MHIRARTAVTILAMILALYPRRAAADGIYYGDAVALYGVVFLVFMCAAGGLIFRQLLRSPSKKLTARKAAAIVAGVILVAYALHIFLTVSLGAIFIALAFPSLIAIIAVGFKKNPD